jgi:predicted secreted protein
MSVEMITVAMRDEFTISLASIATAGYVWKVATLPDAILLLGTETGKQGADAKPGDATNQIFRFRAHKPGGYKLNFRLGRPWESKAIESRTVIVNVT